MMIKIPVAAALCLAAAALIAGCGSASDSSGAAAARSAAASLSASPQFQADKDRLEANMRKDFHPAHPVKSAQAVLTETFPGANVQAIIVYGVRTFKPADHKAGPARTAWENSVVTYALQQGAQGVHGQPSIPGVTSSASPPASHT
jgi:hypothetical protein